MHGHLKLQQHARTVIGAGIYHPAFFTGEHPQEHTMPTEDQCDSCTCARTLTVAGALQKASYLLLAE
eukprot:1159518-Pelagomonas_calceolata.AAC.5